MKRFAIALSIPPSLFILAASAHACGVHPAPLALIHSALPTPLPPNAIIADVEAEPDATGAILPYGLRVRVRRMIQGEAAPALILRTGRLNSCLDVFGNGRTGLIVAEAAGSHDGIPVVRPIFVHRSIGYRLPDGFQLFPQSDPGFQVEE